MSLKLMYITNNPIVAKAAEESGVDWIFIDLEVIGKDLRQAHMDTVKSRHSIDDIKIIKSVLTNSKLLVRTNPIYDGIDKEINDSILFGADILMLPYFKTYNEVDNFLSIVNGRVQTCLLLETPDAVSSLGEILQDERINYIHIGLNDLHLGYKLNFMFELLSNGTVEMIIDKICKTNIEYGFGGIAGLGEGDLPAELIIMEHYRLKSTLAILSRSFYKQNGFEDNTKSIKDIMQPKINQIRDFEESIKHMTRETLFVNKKMIADKIVDIVSRKAK
jgi:hypothetical protein